MMGILAVENIDENLEVSEAEAAEVAVAVADESAEVQQEGDEIGTSVAQIEDAVQAGEELEAIGEEVVETVESGEGLDEKSAEIASLAIESIRSRLGVRGAPRLVPVAESFGSTNSRLASTRLIVEGITDTLKRVWTAIKQFAARVWDKVKSFIANLFNSTTMLNKHIASLKERARKLPSGAAPKEKQIKHAGVARAISLGGKADLSTFEKVAKNTEALAAVAKKASEQTGKIVGAAQGLASGEINEASVKTYLKSAYSAGSEIESVFKSGFAAASSVFSSSDLDAVVKAKPAKSKGSTTRTDAHYGPFVGSTVLTLSTEETTVAGEKAVNFTISFGSVKGKIAEKVAALNPGEIQSILSDASKMTNALQDFKSVQGSLESIKKSTDKIADTIISNVQKILDKTGSSSETRQGLSELRANVNDAIGTLNAFGARAPGLMYQMAKVAADYASISLANMKAA